jgi:hypothetical protein
MGSAEHEGWWPVALSDRQMAHARAMVNFVRDRGLPERAAVVVIETALVESNLTIYANYNVPGSMAIPHEAVGSDHASVGVLQQQVPSWGSAAECMDPVKACQKFLYGAGVNPGLLNLPRYRFEFVGHSAATSWDQLPNGSAAQAVQVSAFPDRYQERDAEAAAIVAQIWSEEDMVHPKDWTAEDIAFIRKHVMYPHFKAVRRMVRNAIGSAITKHQKGWFSTKTTSWVKKDDKP